MALPPIVHSIVTNIAASSYALAAIGFLALGLRHRRERLGDVGHERVVDHEAQDHADHEADGGLDQAVAQLAQVVPQRHPPLGVTLLAPGHPHLAALRGREPHVSVPLFWVDE